METLLSCKNITKEFNSHTILDNLDINIYKNEFVSFLGESGSGKTTLLRVIAKLEEYNGVIECSKNIKVGMLFQEFGLFPNLNIFENISFGISHIKNKEEIVNDLLEKVNLPTKIIKKYPHHLSGGQKQRVALARTLATKPDILLLDEPFSNIDNVLRRNIIYSMKSILEKFNVTTIMVTHDIQEAIVLSDRIAMLNNGKCEQIGTPHELYWSPKSEYIANFMGVLNILESENQRIFLRASSLQICDENDENSIKTTIKDSVFLGDKEELILEVKDKRYKNTKITMNSDYVKKVPVNHELFIKIIKDKVLFTENTDTN